MFWLNYDWAPKRQLVCVREVITKLYFSIFLLRKILAIKSENSQFLNCMLGGWIIFTVTLPVLSDVLFGCIDGFWCIPRYGDSCDSCAEETLNGSQIVQLVKESF